MKNLMLGGKAAIEWKKLSLWKKTMQRIFLFGGLSRLFILDFCNLICDLWLGLKRSHTHYTCLMFRPDFLDDVNKIIRSRINEQRSWKRNFWKEVLCSRKYFLRLRLHEAVNPRLRNTAEKWFFPLYMWYLWLLLLQCFSVYIRVPCVQ